MLSLIVPVYKNKILVEYCLTNLEHWMPKDAELIVVDDASGYETIEILKKFNKIKLITHEKNQGNTTAYNTGANEASGNILVFIDSDVIMFDESLHRIEQIFEDKNVGVAGTLLLYPHNNTIQHAGVAFDKWVLSHIYTGRKVDEVPFNSIENRQAVTAALFACRKSLFEKVGGFDETYRDGLEDIDFCLKCKELGIDIVFSPDVRAYHFESATRGTFKSIRRTYNYSVFFSRWAGRFEPDLNQYLDRSLADKSVVSDITCNEIISLNFCNTPNWPDLIAEVQKAGGRVSSVHNMSGFIAEADSIDLYRNLPIVFQKSTSTILFVLDHFSQLERNYSWFDQRQITDLIVDRHANIISSNYWKKI